MRRTQLVLASAFAAAAAIAGFIATPAAAPLAPPPALTAEQCSALEGPQFPDTSVELAAAVTGPSFAPPGSTALNDLPAFCRVVTVTKPAVRVETWLPMTTWNGKFQGVG